MTRKISTRMFSFSKIFQFTERSSQSVLFLSVEGWGRGRLVECGMERGGLCQILKFHALCEVFLGYSNVIKVGLSPSKKN